MGRILAIWLAPPSLNGLMAKPMLLALVFVPSMLALVPRVALPVARAPPPCTSRAGAPEALLPTLPVGFLALGAILTKPAAIGTAIVSLKGSAVSGTAAAAAAAAAAGASSNSALPALNTMSSSSATANEQGPRMRAVVRILEVEIERLITAVQLNVRRYTGVGGRVPKRVDVSPEDIAEEMEARGPMIRWALVTWLTESLGVNRPGIWSPQLRSWELLPWQWTPNAHPTLTTPTIGKAIRALQPQIASEVRRGIFTAPLQVMSLAWRALLVYALAYLARVPGPQRQMIQRVWPRIVEHLAATLERNHERAKSALGEDFSAEASGSVAPPRRMLPGELYSAFDEACQPGWDWFWRQHPDWERTWMGVQRFWGLDPPSRQVRSFTV